VVTAISQDGQNFVRMSDAQFASEIAKEAARLAIQEHREGQKRGRNDQGQGSLVLGTILSKARTEAKMTQEALADLAGVHPTTIGKIETGDRGMSLKTFCLLYPHLSDDFLWDVVGYMRTM
jgi:DNA-binding XRE family transcriptional regulator